MATKLISLLALLAILFCCANAQSCTASVNATRQATWVEGQVQSRSLWTVSITAGSIQVLDVFLNIAGSISQIWGMDLANGSLYHLPTWRLQQGGLPAGQTHVFGFIINDANANSPVTVSSVQCALASPMPSPSPVVSASASPSPAASASASPAASASASPAASASASPAASASASPSPAASPSPSPVACSLGASQVARQGPGGMWTDMSNRFQIYDLTFQNLGSQRISQASISFNIASDQQITDAWNLRRVDSSNEFFIESSVLPANPGQTQMGAGYILRTPINSTSAGSSIGEVDEICS